MSYAQKGSMHKSRYFIKYNPEFKRFFGSEKAALIFDRLEYWSSKYPSGFWKFFEFCNYHPQYQEGDSWEEELGFSRKVFTRAFNFIGTHYKSKSEYLAQSDPFQGKMYASYYDRKTNRTHFFRNHSAVEQFLSSFWRGAKKIAQGIKKLVSKKGNSRNVPLGSSFTHAYKDNISLQRSTSSSDLDSEPSLPPSLDSNDIPPEEKKDQNIQIAQDMLDLWNNITQNHEPLKIHLKTKLPQALSQSFQGSLETWKSFCLKVASSKFLMGEAPHSKFKAYLAWLIKSETVQAIEEGHYSLGDRQVYVSEETCSEAFDKEKIEGSKTWKDVCEQLCHRLGYQIFKSWFETLKLSEEESLQPKVHCLTPFRRDWIRSRYQRDLEQAIKQVLPQAQQVEISL